MRFTGEPSNRRKVVGRIEKVMVKEIPEPGLINNLFIDSGAFSLYSKNVKASQKVLAAKGKEERKRRYAYYKTDEFWQYVDKYARFLKKNLRYINYYANVDVIYDPDMSWEVQQYLESEYGLNPVPVIHFNTSLKWIRHYLDRGYDFIGLGGLGQNASIQQYFKWADSVYNIICDNKDRLPVIRTHGFAMTSWRLLTHYPWWSVDSASWSKAAAYGGVCVPRKSNGEFNFLRAPTVYYTSVRSRHVIGKRIIEPENGGLKQRDLYEWLVDVGVPYGKIDEKGEEVEWGVVSSYYARAVVNLVFFQRMADALPKWPWPFPKPSSSGFFEL